MERLDKKSRQKVTIIGVCIGIIEVLLGIGLFKVEAKLTLLLAMVAIPCMIACVYYMFKSFENALFISLFIIPLLPLSGYMLLRMNLLDYQWVVYVIFYLISLYAMKVNGLTRRIEEGGNRSKVSIIKLILSILLIMNIVFAYNKQLSFMIISLSFVPFSIYIYIIGACAPYNRKEFFEKIIIAISLGSIVSSIPDILYFILMLVNGYKANRIFGPLGSNFILIYDLIIFVILLNKWVKSKKVKGIWTILTISMAFIISMQLSRGALLSFMCIVIAYLLFDIRNWKKYLLILLVFGPILTYNVMGRADVKGDTTIQEFGEIITDAPMEESSEENPVIKGIIKVIESQSSTRQVLWKAGIRISNDYPITGVGIGNYKYFFKEYSGSDRNYLDSHNIILNMSSEIGLPFAIIVTGIILFIMIYEFIRFFIEKNKKIKLNRLTVVIICGVIFLYGNLTGIAFQTTNEVYSFTPTFILLFAWFYRDNILDV